MFASCKKLAKEQASSSVITSASLSAVGQLDDFQQRLEARRAFAASLLQGCGDRGVFEPLEAVVKSLRHDVCKAVEFLLGQRLGGRPLALGQSRVRALTSASAASGQVQSGCLAASKSAATLAVSREEADRVRRSVHPLERDDTGPY